MISHSSVNNILLILQEGSLNFLTVLYHLQALVREYFITLQWLMT